MKKIKVPVIENDAVINIQIHETFYRKLSTLLIALSQEKSPEEYRTAVNSIKNPEIPNDVYTLTVQVINQIIYEIELMAKEQNKVKDVEIEIPDETTEN